MSPPAAAVVSPPVAEVPRERRSSRRQPAAAVVSEPLPLSLPQAASNNKALTDSAASDRERLSDPRMVYPSPFVGCCATRR